MVFYIELIIFVTKGFNPHFDFLFKIERQWVGDTVHCAVYGEGEWGRGAAQRGVASSVRQEEELGRGMGPGWVSAQGQWN
jgi:hypothetical protein